MINSGRSRVAVSPLTPENTLKGLIKESPQEFAYSFDENQGEMYILQSSKDFCFECSYLIAVYSEVGAKGEIIFSFSEARIPLSVNGILKEKIKASENKDRYYRFNSLQGFNISISLLYGSFNMTVQDPDGKKVVQQKVNSSTVISVNQSESTINYTYEYNSKAT